MDLSEHIYAFPYHFTNIWSVNAVKIPDHIPNDDDGGPVVINSINNISLVVDTGYGKSPVNNKSDAFI